MINPNESTKELIKRAREAQDFADVRLLVGDILTRCADRLTELLDLIADQDEEIETLSNDRYHEQRRAEANEQYIKQLLAGFNAKSRKERAQIAKLYSKYSNPRKSLVVEDWPSGSLRTKATFFVEAKDKKGERAVRVIINPKTGRENAPKALTYANRVVFADGDDGRLYVLELTNYGHISIMKGTFDYTHESIFEDDPRYAAVRVLFDEVTQ